MGRQDRNRTNFASASPWGDVFVPMNRTSLLSAIAILVLAFGPAARSSPIPPAARKQFRVVIDPGHGGPDLGTIYEDDGGRKVSEKQATLLLARQVAKQLRGKGFFVTLTRNHDQEVPLGRRTAL